MLIFQFCHQLQLQPRVKPGEGSNAWLEPQIKDPAALSFPLTTEAMLSGTGIQNMVQDLSEIFYSWTPSHPWSCRLVTSSNWWSSARLRDVERLSIPTRMWMGF